MVNLIIVTMVNLININYLKAIKLCLVLIFSNLFLPNVLCNQSIQNDTSVKTDCAGVTHIFESRGIKSSDIPTEPTVVGILRYCEIPPAGTCCTYYMEGKLAVSSKSQLERNVKDSLGKLSSVLGTRAMKFNSEFAELLGTSKKEFHTMFKRTYGAIYEQNSYVFADLFTELEKYYTRGRVNLSEAIDTFFNTLYQKMFTVLNAQYQFNDKYLGCVSEHMRELKPFGDVPDKLSVQIKRSFVATRTYAQAVITASEIVKKVANTRVYSECTAALTKMQQCGICKGHSEKPCNAYCVNVMKGCLQHFNELDTEWDNFVGAIVKLSERLLGPFNIVMVVEPINIKISEAIMNFQETGQDISNQVFQGCGRPTLGRKRRSLNNDKIAIASSESDILDIDAKIEDEVIPDNNNNNIDHHMMKRSNSDMDSMTQDQQQQHQLQQEHQSEQSSSSETQVGGGGGGGGGSSGGGGSGGRNKSKKNGRKNDDDDMDNREPDLDKLVKDIREKVKESKKFWSNLAYHLCNNEDTVATPKEERCWNGTTVDRYRHPLVLEQSTNPEFPTNQNFKPNNVIVNQLYYLKTTVSHLKNAFNGLDVDWSDQEEPDYDNGSGSGDGIDSDDEDDDEDNIHGSGSHSFDDHHSTIGPMGGRDRSDSGTSIGTNSGIGSGIGGSSNNNQNRKDETSTKKSVTPSNNENETYKNNKANSSAKLKAIPLLKAIVMYLFPIYMAWFGGICTELL